MSNIDKLLDKKWLEQEYTKKKRSDKDIAEELNTYANRVRRARIKLGIESRGRSDAQSAALKSGRHTHPTRGRKRTEEERESISNGVAKSWEELDKEELERRKEMARANWNAMSDAEKENLFRSAAEANRVAAKEGSKLEKYLKDQLMNSGFMVEWHKEGLLPNHKLHIDIFLPEYSIAIEVDGPAHFLPIWGEDNLSKNIRADNEKNGLLRMSGIKIIRIRHTKQELSQKLMRKVWDELNSALDKVINGKNKNYKIEIEV